MKLLLGALLFFFSCNLIYSQGEEQIAPSIEDNFHSLFFASNTVCYLAGEGGRILESTNGGESWLLEYSPITEDLYGIASFGIYSWAAGNNGTILKRDRYGWFKLNSRTSANLRSVFFTNEAAGWAVGDTGKIIKTTNGGDNWIEQVSVTSSNLNSVFFINNNIGFACGNEGTILKTTDGGSSWSKQIINSGYNYFSIDFIDNSSGWICGGKDSDLYGKIIHTTNGGETWLNNFDTQPNEYLYSIKFNNVNEGISVGRVGTIYETTNGGASWIKKVSGTTENLKSVKFNLEKNFIAGNKGILLKSVPGSSWDRIELNNVYNLYSVCFINKNTGWAAGNAGVIIKTTNSGTDWIMQKSNSGSYLIKILFVDPLNGWCLGSDSTILKTSNGGENWEIITVFRNDPLSQVGIVLKDFSFIDSINGFVVGGTEDFSYGIVLKTTDGGYNWEDISTDLFTGYQNERIEFADKNNVWITSGGFGDIHPFLFITTNGGNNWEIKSIFNSNYCNQQVGYSEIDFLGPDTGYVTGYNECGPYIVRTTNNGISWVNLTPKNFIGGGLDGIDYLDDINFFDMYTGWMSGRVENEIGEHTDILMETNDAGNTWDILHSLQSLTAFDLVDKENGWVVGPNGKIFKYKFNYSELTDTNWQNVISIEDDLSNYSVNLTFGQNLNATNGLDENLGEQELPPPPPAGVLNAGFILPASTITSSKDLRSSSESSIIWKINFQPGTSGYPLTFIWNRYKLPPGTFIVKDLLGNEYADMKEQSSFKLYNQEISSLILECNKTSCVDVPINSGWNLLSLPFYQSDHSLGNLFPSAITPAFYFNSETGEYASTEILNFEQGYWIKFDDNITKQFCGFSQNPGVLLFPGWNMIGIYDKDITLNQVDIPVEVTSNFYGYSDGYYASDILEKGKGYWVKASGECWVSLLPISPKRQKQEQNNPPMVEIPIYISDDSGEGKFLTIGLDSSASDSIDIDLGEDEMPPLPPLGAFDARLNLPGALISSLKDFRFGPEAVEFNRIYQVQYQRGEGTKMNLSWNFPSGLTMRIQDTITGEIIDTTFGSGENTLTVNNPDAVSKLKLSISYPSGYVPVELVSLSGGVLENAVELKWKTSTETNNKGFEVQRKLDVNWEKIGFTAGIGTAAESNEYKFIDDFKSLSFKGAVSYRLKQIDYDGSYKYSQTLSLDVNFAPTEFSLFQNYPNPFNPGTTIKYNIPVNSMIEILIHNIVGEKVETFNEGIKEPGFYQVLWEPKGLSSGVYFYTITAKSTDGKNHFRKTQKMLLMK